VILNDDRVEDQHALLVRDEVGPVLGAGIADRCDGDFEILGAIGIGADVQQAVALIDVVFAIGEARRDEPGLAAKLGIDQPAFAGLVIMRIDDDELVRKRAADADKEAGVLLLEDNRIARLVGADGMEAYAVGAVIVVILSVVECAGIVGPYIGTRRVLDDFGTILAGIEIADDNVIIFRAGAVGGPGKVPVRAVMLGAGKAEIVVARLDIAIEQNGFRSAIAWRAHDQGVLLALEHARIIGEGAVRRGDATVVLFDAAADFLVDRLLQRLGRLAEIGLVIGILGVEIGADFRVQRLGLLHHLLPVLRAQPMVRVVALDVVERDDMRLAGGDGRDGLGHGMIRRGGCTDIGR
jgi:hypothetical protein